MPAKANAKPASDSLHAQRFPGESAAYRAARNKLLQVEMELRRKLEEVAAMRRQLPTGGPLPEDYVFEEGPADLSDSRGFVREARLGELFVRPERSLVIYSFMFGPDMKTACPSCTSILDSLDRTAPHASQRTNLVVVARSPIERIRAHARERGWHNLRLLSSAKNSYNRDYHGEDDKGLQLPALNVFSRRDGVIFHSYCTELLFAPPEPGQDHRHVDLIWPLWNLYDFMPEGRGSDWYPQLEYDT